MMKQHKRVFLDFAYAAVILVTAFALNLALLQWFRIPSVTPMIFVLGVFLIAWRTQGYFWGIVSSLASVMAVNYAFTYPYWAFNLIRPECLASAVVMLMVSIMTSTMTTQIKRQEQMKAEAEKERMRGNLLRAVSHDLRTPLTSIYGACSAMRDNFDALPRQTHMKLLSDVCTDAQWLVRMVENLLSVTRIQGDSLSINTTEEPVEEVVGEALEKLKKRYPDAAIRVKIPEEFLMIPMDAVLIEQVTINLLENAIVHSGSILPIDFIVEDHPEHVSFIVRDYGKGLSEEKLQNLFETGTYNNSQSSDSRKGMGIGLSICKTIITAHHGTLSGRNHADGAEFCFTLPKAGAVASEK